MSTFVLIHGAWHGAWCWNKVVPLLEAAGHRAVTLDLPGHGMDGTDRRRVTMDTCAARIVEALHKQTEPAVLVGHSMGGAAISQAAEQEPSLIGLLVYLAAYVPADGCSVAELALDDRESLVAAGLQLDEQAGTARLDERVVRECLYADCSLEDVAFARARLCPCPTSALTSPLRLTRDRSGSVRRVYVECLQDRTITPTTQRIMQSQGGFMQTYSLHTGHSPFFSAPDLLAQHLLHAAETHLAE